MHLKITTFDYHGQEVPLGIELIYESAKGFVFKRINKIARDARRAETTELAARLPLAALGAQARLAIEQDALFTPQQRRENKAWVIKVLTDTAQDESWKRASLADYVLSGHKSTDF